MTSLRGDSPYGIYGEFALPGWKILKGSLRFMPQDSESPGGETRSEHITAVTISGWRAWPDLRCVPVLAVTLARTQDLPDRSQQLVAGKGLGQRSDQGQFQLFTGHYS